MRPQSSVDEQPVTITVSRRIATGREEDFERAAADVLRALGRFEGFLGGTVLKPGSEDGDHHIVYRFADGERLAAWERSPDRARFLEEVDEMVEVERWEHVTGLETWFALPQDARRHPPRWKMWVVTSVALYPLQLAIAYELAPRMAGLPVPARTAMISIGMVGLMSYAVMPVVTRACRRWLYPGR